MKKNETLYLDNDVYQALRKAIFPKPISGEVEELMKKRLGELNGGQEPDLQKPVDNEALKRDHKRLIREVDSVQKLLKKRKVYDDLINLMVNLGVTPRDLSRVDEIIPKLINEWTGYPEDAILFVDFMRNVKAKGNSNRR